MAAYEKFKENKGDKDPVYFMDGTHPQHNTMPAYGWFKQGEAKEIKSNTGRQRLNINGAINIEDLSVVARFDDSINAQSTLALLHQLERRHAEAETIYVICDNAAYYRAVLCLDSVATSSPHSMVILCREFPRLCSACNDSNLAQAILR